MSKHNQKVDVEDAVFGIAKVAMLFPFFLIALGTFGWVPLIIAMVVYWWINKDKPNKGRLGWPGPRRER